MLRLFQVIRDAVLVILAAGSASAAVRQHRMPAEAALARLSIPVQDMRRVRL